MRIYFYTNKRQTSLYKPIIHQYAMSGCHQQGMKSECHRSPLFIVTIEFPLSELHCLQIKLHAAAGNIACDLPRSYIQSYTPTRQQKT